MENANSIRLQEPSARQFVNDLLGQEAFERGDSLALHRPIEVHLQLTSGCNLDCVMCHEHLRPVGMRHGRGLQFLDSALFERLEREILPYSSRFHLGVGGEPMLAPNFLELLERAYAKNQRIHLTTNGTRIATERVAEVLTRCVSTIEISADGATAATYERIRVGASFARLVQNIELLNRQRLDRPAEDRPRLTLCMVLMQSNVHELPLFVELAARLSVDGVSAWPVIPVTSEGRADLLDVKAARPFLDAARARAQSLGIALDLPFDRASANTPQPENPRTESLRRLAALERGAHSPAKPSNGTRRLFCHMPSVALYIFWDGRVYPCANPQAHQGPPLGNLKQQSFAEIWNGKPFRNLRAGLALGDAPDVCRSCPILHRNAIPTAPQEVRDDASDLVRWFGERDLAPVADAAVVETLAPAGDLVDATVESGLAAHVQKRLSSMLAYAQTLERTSRSLEGRVDALEHENAHVKQHLNAIVFERDQLLLHSKTLATENWHLGRHAATLETDRWHLAAHAATLESERKQLIPHVATLEGERSHLIRHIAAIEPERWQLIRHASALESERKQLSSHAATLEGEREQLVRHAATLENERRHLTEHAAILETERKQLLPHVATLEGERSHLIRHIAAIEPERWQLIRHTSALEDERKQLTSHAATLAGEREQLVRHAATLAGEREHLVRHAATLEGEREQLVRHASALEGEREQLVHHREELVAVLGGERSQLARHAATIEIERRHLVLHAATLEAEREHLVRHARNVERRLERIRSNAVFRVLARIRSFFVAKRPAPEDPYIAPWVADGTRKPGEPVGKVPDGPV